MADAATRRAEGDPNAPTHYRVTVKDTFVAANELFRPGNRYTVTAAIYESDAGGVPFKDRCSSANPLVKG